MRLLVLKYIYDRYVHGKKSWVRWAHHRILLSSPLVVRVLFGMKVLRTNNTRYFDLTTVLINATVKRRLRRSPESKMLEIGVGKCAVLSGSLSRWSHQTIDAVDNDSQLVECSRQHVLLNQVDVNVFESDLFSAIPPTKYDIIFWNLPYYRDPEIFLPRLFEVSPDYLSDGGELIIGYNTTPLSRGTVLKIFKKYGERIRLAETRSSWWNLHEVLKFQLEHSR